MPAQILERSPGLDFIYYSNDMIGVGGLLYLQEQGIGIPNKIGLAGFNGVNLLKGLPKRLATMDACRYDIGKKAAEIIAARVDQEDEAEPVTVALEPTIDFGDTFRNH
jgi:LacI family gluconate utilization system Gnt-I transcriptional repressor